MDELEQRVAALELAFFEVLAWLDPAAIEDATRSIESSLGRVCAEEQSVRLAALALLSDGRQRFAGVSGT